MSGTYIQHGLSLNEMSRILFLCTRIDSFRSFLGAPRVLQQQDTYHWYVTTGDQLEIFEEDTRAWLMNI